jgi:hypothetical protein
MGRLLDIARAAFVETEQAKPLGPDKELPIRMNVSPSDHQTDQPSADSEYRPCQHCNGTGKCDCITCGRFKSHTIWEAGPCVPCDAKARQRVQ